jgi:hypothetical protein
MTGAGDEITGGTETDLAASAGREAGIGGGTLPIIGGRSKVAAAVAEVCFGKFGVIVVIISLYASCSAILRTRALFFTFDPP